eukprot:10238931-Alexandrium_andersonii.AAC.1
MRRRGAPWLGGLPGGCGGSWLPPALLGADPPAALPLRGQPPPVQPFALHPLLAGAVARGPEAAA